MPANAAGPWIPPSKMKGPSVVKEIVIGAVLSLGVGTIWKIQQWKLQKKTRGFYEMLEKDQISVIAEE